MIQVAGLGGLGHHLEQLPIRIYFLELLQLLLGELRLDGVTVQGWGTTLRLEERHRGG